MYHNPTILEEVLELMEVNNRTEEDIHWVGCADFHFTWGKFKELANQHEGENELAEDLVIVGEDWYIDISEENEGWRGWTFHAIPQKPLLLDTPHTLFGFRKDPWEISSLAEANVELIAKK